MKRRERIKEVMNTLKSGVRMCVVDRHKNFVSQGLSLSCPWPYNYLYCRDYGQWAHKATLENLAYELDGVNLDDVITESEFEKISGERFFGWGI